MLKHRGTNGPRGHLYLRLFCKQIVLLRYDNSQFSKHSGVSTLINDPSSPFQTNSGPICNVAEWRQDSMKLEIAIRSMTSKGNRTENNLSIHNLIWLDKINNANNAFSCQTWNLLHVMFLPFHPCFNFKHPKISIPAPDKPLWTLRSDSCWLGCWDPTPLPKPRGKRNDGKTMRSTMNFIEIHRRLMRINEVPVISSDPFHSFHSPIFPISHPCGLSVEFPRHGHRLRSWLPRPNPRRGAARSPAPGVNPTCALKNSDIFV